MKLLVLINQAAGALAGKNGQETALHVAQGFRQAGVEAFVHCLGAAFIAEHAKEALHSDVDAIVAAGGDGTLNTVANVVASSHKAFGVLPLGTHNHFAKDLGIPLELEEAVRALATGKIIELPVAEVNGRLFLNFSGIGLHPQIVRDRDAQRQHLGRGKWTAMAVALMRRLIGMRVESVKVRSRGHTLAAHSPSVIVCNNPHQMAVFGVEAASVPDRGLLNVYVTTTPKRRKVVGQLARAAVGALHRDTAHFQSMALPDVRIDSPRKHIAVSVDGEVVDMRPPLMYRIRPRPLKVLVPSSDAVA